MAVHISKISITEGGNKYDTDVVDSNVTLTNEKVPDFSTKCVGQYTSAFLPSSNYDF